MRACEVAALELDDVDWRSGEIVVSGGHVHRLPLPADVGAAIATEIPPVGRLGTSKSRDDAPSTPP